jgi:hypothetical protein
LLSVYDFPEEKGCNREKNPRKDRKISREIVNNLLNNHTAIEKNK